MYTVDLSGKNGIVFGVANRRSIAWAIADKLNQAGARMLFSYQGDRLRGTLEKLTSGFVEPILEECDVTHDSQLDHVFGVARQEMGSLDFVVHSIAFAPKETFLEPFSNVSREDWQQTMDVSAYSLVAIGRRARELMDEGGSIITLTFLAAQRVVPGYNMMGIAKAALEASARFLAFELGPRGIRVNAISAGPLRTVAARSIPGFGTIASRASSVAMLRRNIQQQEVGGLALALISDELGGGITGETIYVDAGYHAMGMILDPDEEG